MSLNPIHEEMAMRRARRNPSARTLIDGVPFIVTYSAPRRGTNALGEDTVFYDVQVRYEEELPGDTGLVTDHTASSTRWIGASEKDIHDDLVEGARSHAQGILNDPEVLDPRSIPKRVRPRKTYATDPGPVGNPKKKRAKKKTVKKKAARLKANPGYMGRSPLPTLDVEGEEYVVVDTTTGKEYRFGSIFEARQKRKELYDKYRAVAGEFETQFNPKKKRAEKKTAKKKAAKKTIRVEEPTIGKPTKGKPIYVGVPGRPDYQIRVTVGPRKQDNKTVYFAHIIDASGSVVDGEKKGRLGPYADPDDAARMGQIIVNITSGADEAMEAAENPGSADARRLRSGVRRTFARPNGIIGDIIGKGNVVGDVAGGLGVTDPTAGVAQFTPDTDLRALASLPQNDPGASFRLGYYYGVLRGFDYCKWCVSPVGMWERWKFRREFRQRLIDASNELAKSALQGRVGIGGRARGMKPGG
jgi:hypothetical protein